MTETVLYPPADPTATPFLPATATPEPRETPIWIDPSVPAALRGPVEKLIAETGDRYVLVETAADAKIKIEPQPERELSQWVYAVVAAFPTVEDEITLGELQAQWITSGEREGLIVTQRSAALLSKSFGVAAGGEVDQTNSENLIEFLWSAPGRLSVVPFEQLEPRLKVLRLDGQSPIDKSFVPERYALLIPFGVSGPSPLADEFAVQLDWPGTNRDPERMTVVAMTGVTALTRATAWRMERKGVIYPAQEIGDSLRQADITHISNEVSFWSECPYPDPVQEGLKFCSDPEYFRLLEFIGVDVVELTGNHNKDFGAEPFLSTLDLYREAGWAVFGAGEDLEAALEPAIIEHNGNRVAFLGCNQPGPRYAWATEASPGAAPCSEDILLDETQRLSSEGVLPIFTFQWAELGKPSEAQREAFQAAAEAGAVIVSGSQAHLPQPMAFHEGAFIHYGLGNLFFDQMQSLALRQQFIDRHVIYAGRHISTELLTNLLEDYAQPRPMQPDERARFLADIFEQSDW